MKFWKSNRFFDRIQHSSLGVKLNALMTMMMIAMSLIIVLMLTVLIRFTNQYNLIVQNLVTASEFNFDFKETLDYKMYQFVIGDGRNFDELDPLSDIVMARSVVEKLKQTTTRSDSLKRLKNIESFLENLENRIITIQNTSGYEINMTSLDYDVRILTEMIKEKVQEYIFYETNELAEIQKRTNHEIRITIVLLVISSIFLLVLLWIAAILITNSITRPIKILAENIRLVGRGDFTVRSGESYDDEIQTLNDAFDAMVGQIGSLLEDVKEEQTNLRQTELKLLQAQINPHFLYNTFDTIIWLAEDHQDRQVVEMITSLSNFFRTTLSRGEDVISLKEEEVHVRSYLEIQQARYRDILEYEIIIPDMLSHCKVPKLTLQPLVENALYHGIKKRRSMGRITVQAEACDGHLCLTVSDNGVGIEAAVLAELNEAISDGSRFGYGLTNVQERIQLYYGEAYGLEIRSEYDVGTRVIVHLPLEIIHQQV